METATEAAATETAPDTKSWNPGVPSAYASKYGHVHRFRQEDGSWVTAEELPNSRILSAGNSGATRMAGPGMLAVIIDDWGYGKSRTGYVITEEMATAVAERYPAARIEKYEKPAARTRRPKGWLRGARCPGNPCECDNMQLWADCTYAY